MSSYSVNDKVALVTGAARGIGLETARLLCERGARVVLVDLDPEATARAARQLGGRAIGPRPPVEPMPAERSRQFQRPLRQTQQTGHASALVRCDVRPTSRRTAG